jgi:hypothetical protein
MIYLYGYLGLGLFALIYAVGSDHFARKGVPSVKQMLDAVDPRRSKLSYRVLHDWIVPAFTGLLLIIAWPLALAVWVQKAFLIHKRANVVTAHDERGFAVEPQHLTESMTLEDVEARERVLDPFDAVPSKPFGHLHEAWSGFAARLGDQDELWAFAAQGKNSFGLDESRSGYVIVRAGRPEEFILTVLKGDRV